MASISRNSNSNSYLSQSCVRIPVSHAQMAIGALPRTPCAKRNFPCRHDVKSGGRYRDRTYGPYHVKVVLSRGANRPTVAEGRFYSLEVSGGQAGSRTRPFRAGSGRPSRFQCSLIRLKLTLASVWPAAGTPL